MRERRAKIAPNDSQERFESLGVDVFRGEAKFISPHEIELNGRRLRGKKLCHRDRQLRGNSKIEGIDTVRYLQMKRFRSVKRKA
jgi:hypothetical protein